MFKVTNSRAVGNVFFQGQSIEPGQSVYVDTLPAHLQEDLRVTGSGAVLPPAEQSPVVPPPDTGNQTGVSDKPTYLTMSEAKAWAKAQEGGAEDDVPEMLHAQLIEGAHKDGPQNNAPWRIPEVHFKEVAYPAFLAAKAAKVIEQ